MKDSELNHENKKVAFVYYIDFSFLKSIIDYDNHFHLDYLQIVLKKIRKVDGYTRLHYDVDDALYKEFEKETGVKSEPNELLDVL